MRKYNDKYFEGHLRHWNTPKWATLLYNAK